VIENFSPSGLILLGAANGDGGPTQNLLLGLALIIALGVAAQWVAWRFNLPSILLLLVFGFLIGPVARFFSRDGQPLLNPDVMFGEMLLPLVSLSVGLILYEGGLSLRLREIKGVRGIVRNLVTIGILVTWMGGAFAAHWLLGLNWSVALLLGAILTVSGPTVIIPMLRFLRPKGQLGSIIKWEGIVNDPIGALLAVLVFEALLTGSAEEATSIAVYGVLKTVFIGGGMGVVAAYAFAWFVRHHWIPDFLHNAVSLMLVVLVFTLSNLVQHESGLFTVTVMGVVLANQRLANVHHIIEFKEHLRVLLISVLFIILAARLTPEDVRSLGPLSLAFVGVMILIVRPIAVFASTVGSSIAWRERVLLGWLAPRGIVAAAVSAVFGLQLEEQGIEDAALLGPLTFLVIIGTVTVYGLSATTLARRLGVADPNPQGVLFVGAHAWSRALAEVLHRIGVRVLMVDSSHANIAAARMAGLPHHEGNVLSDFLEEEVDFQGLGKLVAVTPNDEVNAISVQRFEYVFGKSGVFQVAPARKRKDAEAAVQEMHGRTLVNDTLTFSVINERYVSGAVFRTTRLTESFTYSDFLERYGMSMTPIFIKRAAGELTVVTDQQEIRPRAGDTLICLGPSENARGEDDRPRNRAEANKAADEESSEEPRSD
jgi:NhaP-type Na+/H+ or K+/H+ antiporter